MAGSAISTPATPILIWTGDRQRCAGSSRPSALVWVLAVASSVAQGGFVFAAEALTPNLERMSPAKKLGQMFSLAGLAPIAKSLIPFSVLLYLGVSILARDWELLLRAGQMPVAVIGASWPISAPSRSAGSRPWFCCCGRVSITCCNARSWQRDLRMSKQELRDEYKETDGNPTVKVRLRRLQRQMRRRRMLKEVERATVVITNPTHFAVALEYRPEMAAPVVVAKGCNALAEQIKQVATLARDPDRGEPAAGAGAVPQRRSRADDSRPSCTRRWPKSWPFSIAPRCGRSRRQAGHREMANATDKTKASR